MLFQMMNNMGGEDDLGDLDGADDVRTLLSLSFAFKPLLALVSKSLSKAEPLSDIIQPCVKVIRLTFISSLFLPFRMTLQIAMMRVSVGGVLPTPFSTVICI